jgi:hypothetical protein
VGQTVRDGSPASEATYIARFYAHVNMTSGTPVVFRLAEGAPDAAGTPIASIQYNRTNQQFEAVNRLGAVSTIATAGSAVNNKFYHVHLTWTRASGNLDVVIQGAGSSTALATANLTGFTAVGSAENYVELGWPAGTAVGTINVDAFESRRSTAITRLCRADANASGNLSAGDRSAVTAELAGTLQTGQPDCDESGAVTAGDRSCITGLLAAGAGTCNGSW